MTESMRYLEFPDTKVWNALQLVFLALLLLLSRDCLYSMMILGFYPAQALTLCVLAAMGLCFVLRNRTRMRQILTDPRLVLLAIFALAMLVPMAVKRDWQFMYVSILLAVAMGVFVSYFLTIKKAARMYLGIMAVLSAWSLVCAYLLRRLPDAGLISLPVLSTGRGYEFYFFGLSFVPLTFVTHRNFGVFREPGVYQFFILLALYLNNYQAEWDKPAKLWCLNALFVLTMLSTFATGGVIEMGLLAVVIFFDRKYHKQKPLRIAAVVLVAAMVLLLIFSFLTHSLLYEPVMEMMGKLFTKHESTVDRVGSLVEDWKHFARNPLVGSGLSETLHAVDNNTSSTGILFAVLGVVGGVLHLGSFVALVWRRESAIWAKIANLVIFMMAINTCNIITNPFLWIFPVMALVEKLPCLQKIARLQ